MDSGTRKEKKERERNKVNTYELSEYVEVLVCKNRTGTGKNHAYLKGNFEMRLKNLIQQVF